MSDCPKNGLVGQLRREIATLREAAQFRTLENPAGINLYSNDYLGLARDPRLRKATLDAVAAAESVGSTGSRLLSGNTREWEQLEADFAEFVGTEAALYFGSGYAANIGLISVIAGRGDMIFSDALNHASLIDGIRLSGAAKIIYPHADVSFLCHALHEYRDHPGTKLIVTESVFSMEGDIVPIQQLIELARDYDAELIVDEAHAIGVFGPAGRGVCAALGLEREVFATVHTCGKALASAGAFVCGSRLMKDYLINRARTFIFSTAMPPYLAGQIRAALGLAREAEDARTHLRAIATELRTALVAAGISCSASNTQIIPIYVGENEAALSMASDLQKAGFAVRAIRPPTVPDGTSRIRFSLTSSVSMEDVRRLAVATETAMKAVQCPPSSAHA
ncbi:MAG TPA: 8-amino-7-oxononanoate synthase [Candidatus Acidoferrales bacterium]|nr:8-amino-7-oxononanoate synthase [Candidatus Acidoferrales bacterium]